MIYKKKHVKERFRPKPGKLLEQIREVIHWGSHKNNNEYKESTENEKNQPSLFSLLQCSYPGNSRNLLGIGIP
ncbi:MAG: hypothetical protein JJV91_00050 [Desulfosarcina sp.]|nr:hypothetical protein [Desulfobacterales bacterium]